MEEQKLKIIKPSRTGFFLEGLYLFFTVTSITGKLLLEV